jgi:hypothetical protein
MKLSSIIIILSEQSWSWSYGSWNIPTYAISCEFESHSWRGTQYNIMWLSLSMTWGRSVVFPSTPVSSTKKTGHHDITEILLKVTLNTIHSIILQMWLSYKPTPTTWTTISCTAKNCDSISLLKCLYSLLIILSLFLFSDIRSQQIIKGRN